MSEGPHRQPSVPIKHRAELCICMCIGLAESFRPIPPFTSWRRTSCSPNDARLRNIQAVDEGLRSIILLILGKFAKAGDNDAKSYARAENCYN